MLNWFYQDKNFNIDSYIDLKLKFCSKVIYGDKEILINYQKKLIKIFKEKDYQIKLKKFNELLFKNNNQIEVRMILFNFIFYKYSDICDKIINYNKYNNINFKIILIKINEFFSECNYVMESIYKTQIVTIDNNVSIDQTHKIITSCRFLNDILFKLNNISNYNKDNNTEIIKLYDLEGNLKLKSDLKRLSFLRCLYFNHTFDIKNYNFTNNKNECFTFIQWTTFIPESKIQLLNNKDNSILELLFYWENLREYLKYKLIQLFEWFYNFYKEIS